MCVVCSKLKMPEKSAKLKSFSLYFVLDGTPAGGLVFGIPLTQCVENDRLSRAAAGTSPFRSRGELSEEPATIGRHGSRASFSSLFDAPREEVINVNQINFVVNWMDLQKAVLCSFG